MASAMSSNHPYSATDMDFKYNALKEITILKITVCKLSVKRTN